MSLDLRFDVILRAARPEDLFGSVADVAALKREFRRLARLVHPDLHGGARRTADAFAKLSTLADEAEQRFAAGVYGTGAATPRAKAGPTVIDRRGRRYVVGDLVVRAYATRHGAGPFPTEVSGMAFVGEHNGLGPWQGAFRTGWLDLPLLRYAVDACGGVDSVAVTCLDHLAGLDVRVCVDYAGEPPRATRWPVLEAQARAGAQLERARPLYGRLGENAAEQVIALVGSAAGACGIESFGPRASDKRCSKSNRRSRSCRVPIT